MSGKAHSSPTNATSTSRSSRTTGRTSSTRSTASCATTSTRRGNGSAPTTTRGSRSSPARAGRSVSARTCRTARRRREPGPGRSGRSRPSTRSRAGMEIWKPTIAAVNGYCLGYGLTLVARVRLRHRSRRRRVRLARGPARRADDRRCDAAPAAGRHAGRARDTLTGDRIDAARAKEIGLALAGRAAGRSCSTRRTRSRDRLVPGRAARRAGGQGDGVPRAVPPVGRRRPHGRDDAAGRCARPTTPVRA